MAVNTKRALADSLRKLLTQRTLDKITVRDIVEDCGVNRQTFYYHFRDIYDLLEWIFEDTVERMVENQEMDYANWTCGIDHIVEQMLKDRKLILNAYHSVSHEAVSRFIKRWIDPFVTAVVDREAEGLHIDEEDKQFVVKLFTLATTGFFTEWVENKMPENELKDLEKVKQALAGSVSSILHRFAV